MAVAAANFIDVERVATLAAPWRFSAYPQESRDSLLRLWETTKRAANELNALPMEVLQIDCSTVKPRARAALRLLALRAPRPVHRDTLVDALWPEADPKVGARNLHVVVSSLRQLLEPGVARGASSLIVRDGETYRLDLPADADSDVVALDGALAEGRDALARGDRERAAAAFRTALDLHRGELLPDDGAVDWIARDRDEYRSQAGAAAQALAEIELAADNPEAAAAACDRGLRLDRYRDALWRLRIRASDAAGDVAESARVRSLYLDVLAELGIDPADARPT